MKLVVVESPYAGEVELNVEYARRCLRDCLHRGEAPIASHLLYTQPGVLDDDKPDERKLGIEAGLVWGAHANVSAFYIDRGVSSGMRYGFDRALREERAYVVRRFDGQDVARELVGAELQQVITELFPQAGS